MFTIRPANPKDAGTLLTLIKELAEFEKLAHEVRADERALKENLFADQPVAHALLAQTHDGKIIGFALYFFNFSTFLGKPGLYLEDLYVRPESRGQGVGLGLLAHLAKIAEQRGCGRMEWSVLDWNVNAIEFYQRLGAAPMNEWTVFRVSEDKFSSLARHND